MLKIIFVYSGIVYIRLLLYISIIFYLKNKWLLFGIWLVYVFSECDMSF